MCILATMLLNLSIPDVPSLVLIYDGGDLHYAVPK